ncbi:uncharacterized protein LOC122549974 isoform X3 [Chiloscyllium plagiosum]|uniref:uncharacterized protein LOC122549974 isoform X3 n=1 Tax=Chiloscyllium plagiosum TaxID=36176 RepID=UPI001CB7B938|nr:uncharacterized protein LOC122549974 isoform X3 [Chiloscyllium plagiosum]
MELVEMRSMSVLLFLLFMVPVGSQVTLGPTMRDCSDFTNTSCEECLENVSCLWCFVDQRCMKYPVETIIPPRSICPLNEARWGVCWIMMKRRKYWPSCKRRENNTGRKGMQIQKHAIMKFARNMVFFRILITSIASLKMNKGTLLSRVPGCF